MLVFVAVGKEADVKEGRVKTVHVLTGEAIVLTRVDGKIHAFTNTCPHMHGPLGEGEIAKGVVTCPLHGAKFDVRTGKNMGATFGGQQVGPIKTFPVNVENGMVWVEIENGIASVDAGS